MSLGVRAAVAFVTLIAVSLPAACSGGGNGPRATLTDEACTYEGDTSLDNGSFTIALENETAYFAKFALARLSDGRTIDDLQPYLDKAGREFAETGTLSTLPFPDFYEQVARSGVEAGANGDLAADLPAGTYALMCFADNLPLWRAHRAVQLDVT